MRGITPGIYISYLFAIETNASNTAAAQGYGGDAAFIVSNEFDLRHKPLVGTECVLSRRIQYCNAVMGVGGHGAFPHRALDPIWLASTVLPALYGIIPRRIDPTKKAVITVGTVHAGTAGIWT